jgi:hypothetical protein
LIELRIAPKSARAPAYSVEDAVSAEAWRMPDGTVWGYSRLVDGERWLELPGVGSFHLHRRAREVTAFPEPGVDGDALRDAYRRIVVPIAFQAHGGEVLHASAVRGDLGVVAFCADSHGGKTTMAYAMGLRGYRVWADDAVAIDFSRGMISAVMLPFVLRLRPSAAQFFLGTERAADHDPSGIVEELRQDPGSSAPLSAVFFLERVPHDDASPPHVARMTSAAAFTDVLPQAFCFTLADVERKGLMMRNYLDLSASVPFFRLSMPSGFERIDEVVASVENALMN